MIQKSLLLLLLSVSSVFAAQIDKPNIVIIYGDDVGYGDLSCYGHPRLETPNIDGLAARGVRFSSAYVQAAVCGPSRMSFYTGRTPFSHGATWNFVPLPVGEWTLGDYLRPAGMRVALVGKTHMMPDLDGMNRVGLSPDSERGILIGECGFEPYERDDGEALKWFRKAASSRTRNRRPAACQLLRSALLMWRCRTRI